jgi:hypothetical protein
MTLNTPHNSINDAHPDIDFRFFHRHTFHLIDEFFHALSTPSNGNLTWNAWINEGFRGLKYHGHHFNQTICPLNAAIRCFCLQQDHPECIPSGRCSTEDIFTKINEAMTVINNFMPHLPKNQAFLDQLPTTLDMPLYHKSPVIEPFSSK